MARVTEAEVREILTTSATLTPFITAATLIIDEELLGQGLSNDRLKEIERWLSAHLACIQNPRILQETMPEGMSYTYERGVQGTGLMATSYGQQVKLLDPTGRLDQLSETRPAMMEIF